MSAGWTSTRTRNPLVSPQHCRVRPLTFCSPIVAALAACVGWCDGWGVQDADGRRRIALQRVSRRVPQRSIDGNDGSITIPWGERGANRTHRRTIVRTHAPLAARAMVVQQGVDDRAAIDIGRAAAVGRRGDDQRRESGPRFIGQISCIVRWSGSKRTSWQMRLLLIRTA